MAGERLLRHRVINEPSLIGASSLKPAEPPVLRGGLRDSNPCVAVGTGLDNQPIVAVFTVTVDVDIIGFGVDALTRELPDAQIFISSIAGNVFSSVLGLKDLVGKRVKFLAIPRT